MLSSGSAARAATASGALIVNSTIVTPMIITMLAPGDRDEHEEQLDLAQVGVRARHQLPRLRAVVVREVEPLEVRVEVTPQVRLGSQRDRERRVPPARGAQRDEDRDRADRERPVQQRVGVVGIDTVVDGALREQRGRDLRDGPAERRHHADDDPAPCSGGARGASCATRPAGGDLLASRRRRRSSRSWSAPRAQAGGTGPVQLVFARS